MPQKVPRWATLGAPEAILCQLKYLRKSAILKKNIFGKKIFLTFLVQISYFGVEVAQLQNILENDEFTLE